MVQLQTTNSPFSQEQIELLNKLLPTLTATQKSWISGYLAATANTVLSEAATTVPAELSAPSEAAQENKEVTVLYGSQTGNSQQLAEEISRKLEDKAYHVTLASMHTYKPKNIKDVTNLLLIVSTHGEGEPPDNAIAFHEFLLGRKAPKLADLHFSVLALGDSSYEFFCQTGKELDQRLEELGGTRLYPRVDCDIDFDEDAAEWMAGVVAGLEKATGKSSSASSTALLSPDATATAYSRTNPYQAEILENINLNGRGSNKETRHLELSLEGSGFTFEPGDSVGIFPENDSELADQLIAEMGWNGDESVPIGKQGDVLPLREALIRHFEITVLTKPLLEKASLLSKNNALKELVATGNEQQLRAYLEGRDILDLVRDFAPWEGTAGDFTAILRKIPPRLYSIASSYRANEDEVHLTVGAVRYDAHGRKRAGVCSVQCAERKAPGETLPIFIQRNPNFRLPENGSTPILMVGPGTGVAPFRAFLEEREETGAEGPAWLFFGDQHFSTDFLYQTDWQRWMKEGVLTKMDVAFSRDQDEKVYVQHKMLEKADEVFQWLEDGAVLYICGDEKQMAKDVHKTLVSIIAQQGNRSEEEAEAYLSHLQQNNRYQRDVY